MLGLESTPPFLDSQLQTLMPLTNQYPNFDFPKPCGMGAIFHNQAGDLHTPTKGLDMVSPLSFPTLTAVVSQNPHELPEQLCTSTLAHQLPNSDLYAQQSTYAPNVLMNRDSGYDTMDETFEDLSISCSGMHADSRSSLTTSTGLADQINTPYADDEKWVGRLYPSCCM